MQLTHQNDQTLFIIYTERKQGYLTWPKNKAVIFFFKKSMLLSFPDEDDSIGTKEEHR